MPFIGNQPALSFTSFAKQDFSTSATTSYTLDNPVANANELALFINFVRQEPTTAYSASGTTLTLTSATASSDDMYCVYLGKAVQTVNPPNASVGLSQLTASGTKDATTFLRGDNTFAVAGGTNTPAFSAYLSSDQSGISQNTDVKITINAEDFDTDSAYDHSTNYRFTPQTAGKYFFHGQIKCNTSTENDFVAKIKKNGSDTKNRRMQNVDQDAVDVSCVLDMNGSSDYVELYGRFTNANITAVSESGVTTFFFGYRLIT
jgi:hypothetical protein